MIRQAKLMDEFLSPLHWSSLLIIPSLLIGFTAHELAHALMAYALGDYSQVQRGKITLNPLEHIAWLGSFFFILLGVGWPKALSSINPNNLKQPHLDLFLIAVAGPVASFMMCLFGLTVTFVAILILLSSGASLDQITRILAPTAPEQLPVTLDIQALTIAFTISMAKTNFWLTFMSILPLPGQDGFIAIFNLIKFFRQDDHPESPSPEPQPARPASRPLMSQSRRRNNAANIHFKIGVEYHETRQYDDAIARYRQAIGNDQNFGPAYINMGLAYLAKNARHKAIHAFRGAIKYADDQKSEVEAWHQLRLLSEVSPVDEEEAAESMTALGSAPWTDTRPRPNWWGLGLGGGLVVISGILLYGYLLMQLVEMVKTV